MAEWLRFMAQLAQAQHAGRHDAGPLAGPDRTRSIRRWTRACRRSPPTGIGATPPGATGWPCCSTISTRARYRRRRARSIANLRAARADAVEALADGFLHGGVDAADAGAALYVAAALQVYFTRLAAALPAPSLAAAAAARAVPLLRFDAGRRRGDRVRARRRERAISIARCARRRGIMCAPCASPAASRAR